MCRGESAGGGGEKERAGGDAEVECGEESFRQPGKLKKEHVPTAKNLTRMRGEEFAHHRWMRDVENGEFGDALWMQESRAPCHCGAPIMSGEKDFFPAKLIGDGDDVGGEFR